MTEIKTYSELKRIINLFGKVNFIIISRGGIGKSRLFKETIKENYLILSSHITPLALHREIYYYSKEYDFKNINIIIDDCDGIEKNSLLVSLIKKVSESENNITMHYHSSRLLKEELPETYELENVHISIIANSFKINNNYMNIKALLDRFVSFSFNPDNKEIMKYMKSFAKNNIVFNFIKKYSLYSKNLSLRHYVKGCALQKYLKNWESIIKKDLNVNEVEYVLNSNMKNSEKVKEISKIKKISERQARNVIRKFGSGN